MSHIASLCLPSRNTPPQICKSDTLYKGAASVDSACKGAYGDGGTACNSTGPDIVVGAIHITRSRQDQLQFSIPYIYVEQIVVKPDDNLILISVNSIMTILAPFSLDMWLAILAEVSIPGQENCFDTSVPPRGKPGVSFGSRRGHASSMLLRCGGR